MICTNCGNNIAQGHTSCNRCGAPVYYQHQQPNQQNPYQQNPFQQNPYQQNPPWGNNPQGGWSSPPPAQRSPDMGFLLLAILYAATTLIGFLLNAAGFDWQLTRFFYLLTFAADWAILIVFTRNAQYRLIIIILAALLMIYRIGEIFF